jgi:long-chain acyl-CoA synthetase
MVIAGLKGPAKNTLTRPPYVPWAEVVQEFPGTHPRFATALYDLGVRDDDKVMLYIPNCPQFLIGYFGAQQIGAIPVPVSPIYTPHEIRYLIKDSGAQTVLCQDTNFRYIKEVIPDTGLKRTIVTNYVDLLPFYKRLVGALFDKVPNGVIEKGDGVHSFRGFLKYPPSPPKVELIRETT